MMASLALSVIGIFAWLYCATPVTSVIMFGGYCEHIGTCTEANTICISHRCQCITTFYRGVDACMQRKKPGTACEPGQCIHNSLCINSTCICNKGYKATPTTNPLNPLVCVGSGVAMVTENIFLLALGFLSQLYILPEHTV